MKKVTLMILTLLSVQHAVFSQSLETTSKFEQYVNAVITGCDLGDEENGGIIMLGAFLEHKLVYRENGSEFISIDNYASKTTITNSQFKVVNDYFYIIDPYTIGYSIVVELTEGGCGITFQGSWTFNYVYNNKVTEGYPPGSGGGPGGNG